MAKVTISMVTYNAIGYLPFALPSLSALLNEDVELVINDNASTDESVNYIRTHAPGVKVITSSINTGFGGGHNEVIRQTSSQYVMVFNQDMVIEPEYVRECITFLDAHPEVGSVTGILQRARWAQDGSVEKTTDVDTCGIRIKKSHNVKDNTTVPSWDVPFPIFGPSGACAVYRRTALEDIAFKEGNHGEYFDEDFFMYKEDVDLAYRLRWRGWQSYGIPTARGYHFRTKGDAIVRNKMQVNYWSYRNHWYLLKKNVSTGLLRSCVPMIAGYELAKLGYLLLAEWPTLKTFKDVWRLRARMAQKRSAIMKTRRITDREMLSLFQ